MDTIKPSEVTAADFHNQLSKCIECHSSFIVEPREQLFYFKNNLSLPRRCPECRRNRKEQKLREQQAPYRTEGQK